MSHSISFQYLSKMASEFGFSLLGALSANDSHRVLAPQIEKLRSWQEKGYAAQMSYMERDPELFASLQTVLPEVRSIACFAAPYACDLNDEVLNPLRGYGRVAHYAWGRDYHRVLVKKLRNLVKKIGSEALKGVEIKARAFADAVPILERAIARGAGLGHIGKNSMLISPVYGSFQFLCELVWDIDIEFEDSNIQFANKESRCGSCQRCLKACSRGALTAASIVDASKCTSYLTIEYKNGFDKLQSNSIGNWIFGCDDCQEVCPFNKNKDITNCVAEFRREQGVGPFISILQTLNLRSDKEYTALYAGTPLMRAGREKLIRNACAVAVNQGYFECYKELGECLSIDGSSFVRKEAKKALLALSKKADGLDLRRIRKILL